MTNGKFIFIDVRELLRSDRMQNTMDEKLRFTVPGQTVVLNFLRVESGAPAKFREMLFSWANSKYRSAPMLCINVKEDFKVNLLEEEAANILRPRYRVIPAFDQYFELMGWMGLDEKDVEIDKCLRDIMLKGNISEDLIKENYAVLEILKKNPELFQKSGNEWSGIILPTEVFEEEIKQEISKRGAHIKGDHIELSPNMHSQEYIEATRFIEDQHLIERMVRQLYVLTKSNIENLQCIVTFGDPGAILALAFRGFLQSQGKQLPYIVFRNEESPFPINPEPLLGKRVLILFDVICSGALLEKICRRIEAEGGIIVEIATVVNINVPKEGRYIGQVRRLCEYTFELSKREDCKHCRKTEGPTLKKPDPYLKTIRPLPHQEMTSFMDLFREFGNEVLEFWGMAEKAGALREHVRITDKDRHYFFYVDTYSIFKMREHMTSILENFSRRMIENNIPFLQRITFLHPPNLSAQLLAEELRRFWSDQKAVRGIPYPENIYIVGAFVEEGRLKVREMERKFIGGNILILDDGANTGDTLRSLISITNGEEVERVDACIFVDRLLPEERTSVKRLLAGKNGKLMSLYEIPIANYIRNPVACPYCREKTKLEELKDSLTTGQAIDYCMGRISELKPLEMAERSLALEFLMKRKGSRIKLGNEEVSEGVFKAIVLHLKWKLRGEDKASIPVLDLLDDLESSMKVSIIETLDEKEIRNPRVFEVLMNLLVGTEDLRLFETIIIVLANAQDWRFREKLKESRIEKIPGEKLPFFAFLNEICQLKNGTEIDTWWPNIRNRIEGTKEEIDRIEIISKMGGGLIGESAAFKKIVEFIEKVAPGDSSVLLTGETGTGKELVARAIHKNSGRAYKSFVAVDCATLPETLVESELFGHVAGAFTGAISNKVGLFEQANGGTVFLDEVENISPAAQAKLLRVLQEHEVRPLGDTKTKKIDVRIIAAANKNLGQLIKEGKFRDDLFYRLNVISIKLPPLRERPEDIPVLAEYFLRKHAAKRPKGVKKFASKALNLLIHYDWPGNVRELDHCIEHAVTDATGSILEASNLPGWVIAPQKIGRKGQETLEEIEKGAIVRALEKFEGNQSRTANFLGISERNLRFKMRKHGISNPSAKPGRPKRNSAE